MQKFKTYHNEDEEDNLEFVVLIIHGHSKELHKLERYIKDELGFNAVILKDIFSGRHILEKFKDTVWEEIDCVIALMSPDDKLENGNYRARQNIIYELGYCQGVFDGYYEDEFESEPVTIIKEKSIDFSDVSDLLGLEVMEYTNGHIEAVFHKVGKYLNEFYAELGRDEV